MIRTKIKIHPELCCYDCGGVIHNHMECPVCDLKYASTNAYGELGWCLMIDEFLQCESCKTKFYLISKNDSYIESDWTWEYEENQK